MPVSYTHLSDHMFRNTYNIYDHGKVSAVTRGGNHSAAVPVDYPEEEKWYWPGHGFVKDDVLYIFQFLMYQGADRAWGFRFENTHLLEYRLPDLTLIRESKIPYSGPSSLSLIHIFIHATLFPNMDGEIFTLKEML